VGAGAAAGGQLAVEDVERVGGELRDVDHVQGLEVASDDPGVLSKRRRWPAAGLDRDPLLAQITERAGSDDREAVLKLDSPAVALGLGVPFAGGLHHTGAVPLPCERVAAEVRAQLPHAWPAFSHAACHGRRVRPDGIGWDSGWDRPKNLEAPERVRGF